WCRSGVEHASHPLKGKEFVRRERRSSVAGETAYVFRHVLVRDVAYSQIPRKRRGVTHRATSGQGARHQRGGHTRRRAAGWMRTLAGARPEDLADMVAHHYLSALDLDRRSGREDPELAARARTALVEAGDRSFSLNAFPAAARFYEQALALTPEADAERPRILLCYGRDPVHAEGSGKEALREAADEFLEAGEPEQAALALVARADFVHCIE